MTEHEILSIPITMSFGDTDSTVYLTLLRDKQNIILVDCCFIGTLSFLESELQRHGLSAGQLTGLVLTHHDHDYMGAAAAFKRVNPRITIYASAVEAPFISAWEKPLRLSQAEEMQKTLPPGQQDFGRAFCNLLRRVVPVEVDCFFRDGEHKDWCGECTVLATPGHTPGIFRC